MHHGPSKEHIRACEKSNALASVFNAKMTMHSAFAQMGSGVDAQRVRDELHNDLDAWLDAIGAMWGVARRDADNAGD